MTDPRIPGPVYAARGDRTKLSDGALASLIDGLEALFAARQASRHDLLELSVLKDERARRRAARAASGARWFIRHEDVETPENGVAYFGPFGDDEIVDRVNDDYAELLAGSGDVEDVLLTAAEVAALGYVNPRAYWLEQLAALEAGR